MSTKGHHHQNSSSQASNELKTDQRKLAVVQGDSDTLSLPTIQHDPCTDGKSGVETCQKKAEPPAIDKVAKTDGNGLKDTKMSNVLEDVETPSGTIGKCKKVLFVGPAGAGKTTVLKKLASHSLLEEKIVFMPDFHTFNPTEKVRPSHVLCSNLFSDNHSKRMRETFQWLQENSNEVAVIVDSLDKMPFDFEKERRPILGDELVTIDIIVHNLLSGSLLPDTIFISSSREYKVRKMHRSIRPDRFILVDGLRDESVNDLLKGILTKERAEKAS